MRHLFAIGGVIAICVVMGLGFMLARKSRAALEPGVLFPQVSALVSGWDSQSVPESGRVVNIIVGDSEIASLVNKLSGGNSGEQSVLDAEILPSADKPSVFSRFGCWFTRTFLRRTMSADGGGALARSFPNLPNTVTWTYTGFETASEEEMAKEFMKAIIKANDAGAEVNIVTQGIAAAPALKAIKRLEGVIRNNRQVSVNKLVALDMNKPTLQKLDPVFFNKFKRPANLTEYANIWQSPSPPHERKIELFTQNHNGAWFRADKLLPTIGLLKAPQPEPKPVQADADMVKFTSILLNRLNTLEKVVDYMVKTAKAQEEAERIITVTARDLKGRTFQKQMTVKSASKPMDSLSAIDGGWLKEETEKAEKEAPKTEKPAQNQTRQTDNTKGNAANCKGPSDDKYPRCNWWDARAYCGGRLPTVAQLQSWYQAECAGLRTGPTCNKWYWSSEESGSARAVSFGNGAVIAPYGEATNDGGHVRCAR